ncbi:MAG: hypothetical protein JOY61_12610 [Chloroflexi bacterium]|nr:hypothetical protein [Chloroflexota bacterium]
MQTPAILGTFAGAFIVAVVAFVAHARLAGSGERPGCMSMMAFVIGWLAVLTAAITGLFLIAGHSAG